MRNWLKWLIARQEMATLERYRAAVQCADRWLAAFPDAVDAISHVKAWGEGNGGETGYEHSIEKVRERMRLRFGSHNPESHGLPPYPTGDVVGPCVCGSWPGGKCLKCPVVANQAKGDA